MGGERPYTKTELAQIERDQHDPAFLEWLARMDTELALFFERDVPDFPCDPWTEDGLRHAEQAALRYQQARLEGDLSWRREREPRFARYLGEVFVRNFEGRWKYVDVANKGVKSPVVLVAGNPEYFRVAGQVQNAVIERTGAVWAWLFERSREDYEDWVASGRLGYDEWLNYRVERTRRRLGGRS